MSMRLSNIVTVHTMMEDLWDGKVTPENFREWRSTNLRRILDTKIATEVAISLNNAPVKITDN